MRLRFGLTASFAILATTFSAGVAEANDVCSDATLNGDYGLHASGSIIGVGDFAAVGRFTFDGKGSLAATLFTRVNGNNNKVALTGTYAVNPDCTVSDTWNDSTGTSTHESVIVDDGQGYFILNTTIGSGAEISGEARKQFTAD